MLFILIPRVSRYPLICIDLLFLLDHLVSKYNTQKLNPQHIDTHIKINLKYHKNNTCTIYTYLQYLIFIFRNFLFLFFLRFVLNFVYLFCFLVYCIVVFLLFVYFVFIVVTIVGFVSIFRVLVYLIMQCHKSYKVSMVV